MGIINDLAENLEAKWAAKGFREAEFPKIAAHALVESDLTTPTAQRQLFDRLMGSQTPIRNHVAKNVLTVYENPRFTVHLHLWKDGDIALHHHEWGGAYRILKGTCIAGTYSFQPTTTVCRGLMIGEVKQETVRLMQAGDAQLIEPGSSFIHGLSYITKTALTISVRSRRLYDATSMWYLRPTVAVRHWADESVPGCIKEYIRLLTFLRDADPLQHRERLIRMAGHEDIFVSLEALRYAQTSWTCDEILHEMRDAGGQMHGEVFEYLFESSRDLQSRLYLCEQRRQVPDERRQLRTFLSLMHVCQDLDALLHATSELVDTKDPGQWIRNHSIELLKRVSETASTKWLNGIGEIMGHLLRGVPRTALLAELEKEYAMETDERQRVLDIASELLENPAFRVLRPKPFNSLM